VDIFFILFNRKFTPVKHIITALPNPSFNEKQSIDTFGVSVLNELIREQIPETDIISFAQMLIKSGKNERALHLATEIAMRRSPPTALVYLEQLAALEPLRPHYFWPLIMYNFRRFGESGIITTLKHMERLKSGIDNETLYIYVFPQMRITLENPKLGAKMLADAGIKPSQFLTPLLRHLLSQQKITEALQIVDLYPVKLDILEQLLPTLTQLSVNVRATRRYPLFAKLLHEISKRSEKAKDDVIGQLTFSQENFEQQINENKNV